jgi:hypothetical protein
MDFGLAFGRTLRFRQDRSFKADRPADVNEREALRALNLLSNAYPLLFGHLFPSRVPNYP